MPTLMLQEPKIILFNITYEKITKCLTDNKSVDFTNLIWKASQAMLDACRAIDVKNLIGKKIKCLFF